MFTRIVMPLAILLAFAVSGCQQQSSAAAAGLPASFVPIGPTPGYEKPPKVQPNPYANDTYAMNQGRKLFLWYNCYGCHGGHGGGGMGPSLRDQIWVYGSTDAEIFNSIAQGRGKGMPAWGLKVPENQLWQLVAYIKAMRTAQEPDPPE